MKRRFVVALATLWTVLGPDSAGAVGQDPLSRLQAGPRAQVLLLGVFHFEDAGLDAYKPEFAFDIRAPERLRELSQVLDQLAAWGPTRIAVEARTERQSRLDSLFARYPGAGRDTVRNETHQIGFQLSRRLGLGGVFAIDAPARSLDPDMTQEEWSRRAAALRRGPLAATDWNARFTALYRHDDSIRSVLPLKETLLRANRPERLTAGQGHYLVGNLLNGEPGEYFGADGFVSAWYNRNIRIYSNIVRLIRSPEERVLVIIGAGHVPILRHLFQSSPVATLVEVSEVLR